MLLLPKFDYFEPRTVAEACSLLGQYGEEARVLAGGTDLLVKMKTKVIEPRFIVNLKSIPNLSYINYSNKKGLRVGALTTIHDLAMASVIEKRFGILGEAIRLMGTAQTRSMATIGGNLCNASPAAATATPLVALGAEARIASPNGERVVLLEQFFTGPGKTVLESDEILTEISVPNLRPYSGWSYLKLSLRRKELAVVSVAVVITLDARSGRCRQARIVLGAVAPTVIRVQRGEVVLEGKVVGDDLIEEACLAALEEARPISDVRSTAEYRREMVRVLTRRAAKQALELAQSA